eukprot:6205810-Pleurochrysis_carterae.AAC.1
MSIKVSAPSSLLHDSSDWHVLCCVISRSVATGYRCYNPSFAYPLKRRTEPFSTLLWGMLSGCASSNSSAIY